MGARPSSFKRGGGFLNNVDGTIVDYEFTDDIITKEGREPFKPGKYKTSDGKVKERFHALNFILSVRVDGADEPVTTTLFAGGAEDFEVSEDGKTVTPLQQGGSIGANTGLGKFIMSLCDPGNGNAGYPEENLSDGDDINYEPILGTRCRFVQRVDEEANKKFGKRKKDGKEYNRTDLAVDEVYEAGDGTVPEVAGKKGVKKATNGSGKALPTKTAAKGKPVTNDDEEDVPALAEERLRVYLEAADGSLSKSKLRMKVLQDKQFSGKGELREAVIKQIFDDKWLANLDGVAYDKSDKAQMVSLEG